MMDIDDLLSNGQMVRRWSLVDGFARCVEDAIGASDAGALAALQRNAAVRTLIGLVELYEAALAILALGEPDNGEPKQIPDPAWIAPEDQPDAISPLIDNPEWALLPRTVETTDSEGVVTTAPEPRWQAYDAAAATVADASASTIAHARWRAGEPIATDAEAHDAWQAAKDAALAELARLSALPLVVDPRWPTFDPLAVKAECGRRIYGVAPDSAQKNMLANIVAGAMSAEDKKLFDAGVAWIAAMQAACRSLIIAGDRSFTDDAHWPEIPAGVADLASRF